MSSSISLIPTRDHGKRLTRDERKRFNKILKLEPRLKEVYESAKIVSKNCCEDCNQTLYGIYYRQAIRRLVGESSKIKELRNSIDFDIVDDEILHVLDGE